MNECFFKTFSDFWKLSMVCSFKHFFLLFQQILVPESQISPVEELSTLKEKANPQEEFVKPPKHIKNSNKGDRKHGQPEVYMVSE